MKPILLLAINARWAHTAFGARSLIANLGDLRERAVLVEMTVNDRAVEIVEAVLAHDPALLALGVYIWNAALSAEVVAMLKALRPDLPVLLGGPEMICRDDLPAFASLADHVVSGEAEIVFPRLCREVLEGRSPGSFVVAETPDLKSLAPPYDLYDSDDLALRKIYVEASRGCPYGCKFCLSSLDEKVRTVPAEALLESLDGLWERGARHFKFVDRALHHAIGPQVLEFFLDRGEDSVFLHFELVPDHLPHSVRECLTRFAPGAVQLEAGIQTFDPEVAERIGRRQDAARAEENLRFLRRETGVHIHADLIVGLPGESLESFAAGFDHLYALRPHEIQVGLLKRLRGTALAREADGWGLVFNPDPPYEVLQSDRMSFSEMQRMRRFARFFDLVHNNGNFPGAATLLLEGRSPFERFLSFSDWLYEETGQSHRLALNRLARLLARYLVAEKGMDEGRVEAVLTSDYERAGRKPIRLRLDDGAENTGPLTGALPERQLRHSRGE